MSRTLSATARREALTSLSGWIETNGHDAIYKTFIFKDFNQAFDFMTRVASISEKINHHPEWRNVYNRVDVILATHDAEGVTECDIYLARAMDAIAAA